MLMIVDKESLTGTVISMRTIYVKYIYYKPQIYLLFNIKSPAYRQFFHLSQVDSKLMIYLSQDRIMEVAIENFPVLRF